MTIPLLLSAAPDGVDDLDVPSIDVYLTYKCSLRCAHCFLGDNLSTSRDMAFDSVIGILDNAAGWGAHEVTFLGGEPTMYPRIDEVIEETFRRGLSPRIVTNGQNSFARFMARRQNGPLPFICFSIDGSSAETHDAIRGAGTFAKLLANIREAKERGYGVAGILSVSRQNVAEVGDVLRLTEELGLAYVNVHYVTDRGFATDSTVLDPDEWAAAFQEAVSAVEQSRSLDVRIEKTFYQQEDVDFSCAVTDRSNLMFLPDGRVFMCMMFIDIPDSHSFTWDGKNLRATVFPRNEGSVAGLNTAPSCPALSLVNARISDSLPEGGCVQCIYAKERLTAPTAGG